MTTQMTAVAVAIEICRPGAVVPQYAHPADGGMDITCPEAVTIPAGKTVIVPTGLKVAVPEGWMLLVFPRSGLSAKSGLRVANSPGLIDAGYRDEVGVILHNTGSEDYQVSAGMRIAQFVLMPRTAMRFALVNSVREIGDDRGGGFGHTGQ
ncbi:MAG TPA: dUTP diphosphatase [Armatimonadota bacterium]|jgi:dUTP pyrophosphatase